MTTLRRFALGLAASTLAITAAAGCSSTSNAAPRPAASSPAARIERGRLLVEVGGCNDCHTPVKFDPKLGIPVPQMDRMLSGHPDGAPDPSSSLSGTDLAVIGPTFTSFRLPFGVVYSANLTPDLETGLGSWTEEMFVRAIRTGRHFGGTGRPILPPMPWMQLNQRSDEDLKSIFAYLRSVKPIHNGVPSAKVPQIALDQLSVAYDKVLSARR
jgi:mono/diheme cytochrome c family protein